MEEAAQEAVQEMKGLYMAYSTHTSLNTTSIHTCCTCYLALVIQSAFLSRFGVNGGTEHKKVLRKGPDRFLFKIDAIKRKASERGVWFRVRV